MHISVFWLSWPKDLFRQARAAIGRQKTGRKRETEAVHIPPSSPPPQPGSSFTAKVGSLFPKK